jgi:DNA-binding ferritin-like protein (Dps family)
LGVLFQVFFGGELFTILLKKWEYLPINSRKNAKGCFSMANIVHLTAPMPVGKPATAEELKATENQPKFTISKVEYLGRYSTVKERQINHREVFKLTAIEAPDQARAFSKRLDKVVQNIESELPSLKSKHWDFSINGQEEFVIHGKQLSLYEISGIRDRLEESGLTHKLSDFRETIVKAYELERGPELYSNNWARFNLESDTFHNLIHFKDLNSSIYNRQKDEVYEHGLFDNLYSQLSSRGIEKYNTYTVTTYV